MIGGGRNYRRPRLGIWWMALALALAAFLGAALGLVVDFNGDDEPAGQEVRETAETG